MGCILSSYTNRQLTACTLDTIDKFSAFDFQGVYDVKIVEILSPNTFRGVMYFKDNIYQFRYQLLNCDLPSSNPNDIPYIIGKSKLMAKLPLDKTATCVCLRNAYNNGHLLVTIHVDPDGLEHLTVNDWMNKYEYTKPTNGRRYMHPLPPIPHPSRHRGPTRLNVMRPPPLRLVQSPIPPIVVESKVASCDEESVTSLPSFSSTPSTPPSAPTPVPHSYTEPRRWPPLPRSQSAIALTTLPSVTTKDYTLNGEWDFVEE